MAIRRAVLAGGLAARSTYTASLRRATQPQWPRQRRIVLFPRSANFRVLALARVGRSITQEVRERCPLPKWWGLRRARGQ
jgi:hypothetical protein